MMIKKKSNPWARLKYLYVLPLATVAVAAFARPEVSNQLDEISDTKVNDLVSVVKTIEVENEDSISKSNWYPAVPVAEADTVERLVINLEVGKKPLFVVDGVPMGNLSLNDINAAMVESATLLDKTEAMKLYGEKAKDGALVITSKKPEETKIHKDVRFTQGVSASDEKFTMNGQVMDHKFLKPVPGASVIVRGTTNGTLADAEGKFKLQVKKGDVIIVSYVGLQTQQISVNSANLVVWMDEDVQSLEGMVVYATDNDTKAKAGKSGPVVYDMPIEEAMKAEKQQKETPQKEEVVFHVVEQMPEFPGGLGEAMKFLAKNIKYPVVAQQAKIEGQVIVQFVVGKDGSISDVMTVQGVSPDLDAEAMRVVSLMPKWNPGKQRGKAVSVKYTMPIMFRLETPQPEKKEEEKPAYLQFNMEVDKDVSSEDVAMVKDVLREGYREMTMEFPQGVNKSVEQLPSGGVGYYSEHSRTIRVENGKSPLIIVDGEVKGNGMDILKSVPVNQIQTISVMKDKDSIAKYGDKANDGVIEIVTKKNK